MLEHRPRRDRQPRPPRPAHQLDRHDAVAAQLKEVVVDPDPLQPQHLGKQPAQHRLLRSARRTLQTPSRKLRRRQRTTVELAVRRQRQPIQHHDRRRHHVVRQARAPAPPAAPAGIQRSPPQPPPHSRPAACRDAAAEPPPPEPAPSSRATTTACDTPGLPQQHSLDLARLDPEPAKLDLRVRPPQKLQHPVRTPPRQVPGPVHPAAPAAPMRVRDKPLRRQTRTPQIAPRKPNTRDVKLANNPRRHRLKSTIQNIDPRVPDRTADRRGKSAEERFAHGRTDRRFGRTVSIDHAAMFRTTCNLFWRTRIARDNQSSKRDCLRQIRQQHRR